jgi:hypothetical protein
LGRRFFFFHFLDSAVLALSGGSSPFESELCNLLWRGIIRVFGFLELDSRVEPPVVCGRGASVEDVLGEAQSFFCFFCVKVLFLLVGECCQGVWVQQTAISSPTKTPIRV